MLAAMMVKGGLLALKVRMDYSEFGGAPLLGVNGVVIKAHGSSDAKAIRNAIRQAKTCAEKYSRHHCTERQGSCRRGVRKWTTENSKRK